MNISPEVRTTRMIEFPAPIEEGGMSYDIDATGEYTDRLTHFQTIIQSRVTDFRKRMGLMKHPNIWSREERNQFVEHTGADREWLDATKCLGTILYPGRGFTNDFVQRAIYAPHWNDSRLIAKQIRLTGDNKLHVVFKHGHSYSTQLAEALQVDSAEKNGIPSTSVVGVEKTIDEQYIVGLRGGGRFSGIYMLAPAGFVDLVPSGTYAAGRHPLMKNWVSEQWEEFGIRESEAPNPQCIGITATDVFEDNPGNLNFVFLNRVNLTLAQVHTAHQQYALDKDEHKALEGLRREEISSWIRKSRIYDPTSVDTTNGAKANTTTTRNEGTLSPHASLPLLTIARMVGIGREEIEACLQDLRQRGEGVHNLVVDQIAPGTTIRTAEWRNIAA